MINFSLARQRFYQAIHQPEPEIDLARAALHLAEEDYPDLDPDKYLNALDRMAAVIEERLPPERYPLRIIQAINQYLYEDLGFHGNTVDYYDPLNSFINVVIDRRTGIPITLALVYLEVAKRIGFPMEGVGMPGHFLIRPAVAEMEIFVDPFNGGEVLFSSDCQERLSQVYGRPIELHSDQLPDLLPTVGPKQFLVRMLTNLKLIYLSRQEMAKALASIERILLLMPDAPIELRDRGLLYYQTGRWTEAYQDLERYLLHQPTADDASVVRRLLQRIDQSFTE